MEGPGPPSRPCFRREVERRRCRRRARRVPNRAGSDLDHRRCARRPCRRRRFPPRSWSTPTPSGTRPRRCPTACRPARRRARRHSPRRRAVWRPRLWATATPSPARRRPGSRIAARPPSLRRGSDRGSGRRCPTCAARRDSRGWPRSRTPSRRVAPCRSRPPGPQEPSPPRRPAESHSIDASSRRRLLHSRSRVGYGWLSATVRAPELGPGWASPTSSASRRADRRR